MFKARLRKYWTDYASEYEEIRTNSLTEILEYVYRYHANTCYPGISRFFCKGSGPNGGCLEANHSLKEKSGYRGSVWLENITYTANGDTVIIFSKHHRYISPKAIEAFDAFAVTAKERESHPKFGDF